jgi:hypothetical protein
MKIEFTPQQLNNLFAFLDRVEIKGFNELQAMNELLAVLDKTQKENQENNKK